MKAMKNLKLANILFLVFALIIVISCSKDDDGNGNGNGNRIVKLTASPKTIVASTFMVDADPVRTISNISFTQLNEINFIVLNVGGDELFISADDDFIPNGKKALLKIESNTYEGQDFTATPIEGGVSFSGQVTHITDSNDTKDLVVSVQESQVGGGSSVFTVTGENAFLSGILGTYTYNQILEINSDYPNVKTIVLGAIDGSVNDDINVETGRLIRMAGYATHLKSDSDIASGGVDLFCSGKTRTREAGSKIGVHAWCCYEGKTADQLAKDSPGHDSQISYFKEMLSDTNGPAFYFFTINAASFDEIHEMTDAEIAKYQLTTN